MNAIEENYDEMKEIRSKVDSLAGAIFLIAGGALTLSISVLVNSSVNLDASLRPQTSLSWYLLLSSLSLFIFLKVALITQSFMRQFLSHETFNRLLFASNTVLWVLGLAGLTSFLLGMWFLISVAVNVAFT